ncbi:MAG TPA: hypothetical protein VNQ77_12730 [Frankiaceae bacterium]|nr:hypothetical protein [Frankiaceae bacterium]
MSEATLERRCRLAARAYPEGPRAAEVVATLMDSNEGRRGPRPGDVLDVLRHGVAARLRSTAPGTRLGGLGDALSAMVVTLAVMQAATAVAVTARGAAAFDWSQGEWAYRYPYGISFFAGRWEALAAIGAAAVAVVAVTAMCFGRVRVARVLVALTAAAGFGAIALTRALGQVWSFRSHAGIGAVFAGVVVLAGVLFTTAVARASRVVPAWWWGMCALLCGLVATAALQVAPTGYGWRLSVVSASYAMQPAVLVLFALPLLRSYPYTAAGAALVGVLVIPFGPYVGGPWTPVEGLLLFAAGLWGLVALTATVALRRTRRREPGW